MEVFINRMINAPRSQVFRAWTEEELFRQWWGPRDSQSLACRLDVRKGGSLYLCLADAQRTIHRLSGTYQEVDDPELLRFSITVGDKGWGKTDLRVVNTVILVPRGYGTGLTLQSVVMQSSPDAVALPERMETCLNACMDRLEEVIRGMYISRAV